LSTELETSESALRVALHRLRKRYSELVHLCVLDLVADPSNVDAEITDLLNVLAN
jgi:RNA polymerase sigma-70 factor (ECF subfamily)